MEKQIRINKEDLVAVLTLVLDHNVGLEEAAEMVRRARAEKQITD